MDFQFGSIMASFHHRAYDIHIDEILWSLHYKQLLLNYTRKENYTSTICRSTMHLILLVPWNKWIAINYYSSNLEHKEMHWTAKQIAFLTREIERVERVICGKKVYACIFIFMWYSNAIHCYNLPSIVIHWSWFMFYVAVTGTILRNKSCYCFIGIVFIVMISKIYFIVV